MKNMTLSGSLPLTATNREGQHSELDKETLVHENRGDILTDAARKLILTEQTSSYPEVNASFAT